MIARAAAPGVDAQLVLPAQAALQHTHVIGPTGVGKSVLLGRLIEQDIAAGRAVVLIEPKGDLVDDVLARIPDSRRDDVVVLDAADASPVGLNPLAAPGERPEVTADLLLSVFKALYADAWGPRTNDVLHSCLLTLARCSDALLAGSSGEADTCHCVMSGFALWSRSALPARLLSRAAQSCRPARRPP